MTSPSKAFSACALALVLIAAHGQCVPADDTDSKREGRETLLRAATRHMKQFEARRPSAAKEPSTGKEGDSAAKDAARRDIIPLIERPLLTYGDSARANENGTLWAFGTIGRPLAFLELYQGTGRNSNWIHAVTLTSHERAVMTGPNGARWTPKETQIEPKAIPGAPAPDAKGSVRLRQMKDLARRFAGHEFWDPDNSRFELRLLVQPVHRYTDGDGKPSDAAVQDGAAFILAHDTNPEIVLLIEALGTKLSEARWHFSAARLGSAELHLALDGQEVWKQIRTPGVVGRSTDPYWLFLSPATADP